ncbi:MAG TPA: thioredoxin family protein [Actinomycetota bacterium]|jgi:thioredoxin-like negative regulator of GroEL|nr:thioredoxin family protein [Actinomycetota bacterium]
MELAIRLFILLSVGGAATFTSFALRRYFRSAELPARFDRKDVDLSHKGPMLVEFTSPFCYECQVAYPLLQAASAAHDAPLAVIDARDRPDLTSKYSIRTTPTILVVDKRGKVTTGWMDTSPSADDITEALALAR